MCQFHVSIEKFFFAWVLRSSFNCCKTVWSLGQKVKIADGLIHGFHVSSKYGVHLHLLTILRQSVSLVEICLNCGSESKDSFVVQAKYNSPGHSQIRFHVRWRYGVWSTLTIWRDETVHVQGIYFCCLSLCFNIEDWWNYCTAHDSKSLQILLSIDFCLV